MMGSPVTEKGRHDRKDYHQVTLTEGFWLGEIPVTQEFYVVITGEDPSYFKDDLLPVERISWNDAQAFIRKLSSIHPDLKVRLPWEAEWEYACRAVTTTAFNFGDEINLDLVNYRGTWDNYEAWGKKQNKQLHP